MATIKVNVNLNLPTSVPPKLVQLLSIDKKSELKKFCDSLTISKQEFAALVLNCGQHGYFHNIKWHILEPEHLHFDPKKIWPMGKYEPGDTLDEQDMKLMGKIDQLGRDRRLMTAHIFAAPGRWHVFYFDQRDWQNDYPNHWKHGPHMHFANYLWPEYSLEKVLTTFNDPKGSLKGTIHIRFIEDDDSEAVVEPVAAQQQELPMPELARIRSTSWEFVKLTPQQRLDETAKFVENLALDMPKQIDTGSLFKISLIPPRLVAAHEVLRYRMLELSKSACDCFRNAQPVSGSVLTRSAFETGGLLLHVEKRVSKAVEDGSLKDVGQFLLQALLGVKEKKVLGGAKYVDQMPVAVNVLTSIQTHMAKLYPALADEYAMLCELAHPNQLGGLLAYGDATVAQLSLVPKPDHATPVYPLLSAALKLFEYHYNRITDVFPAFVELCKREAPRSSNVPNTVIPI